MTSSPEIAPVEVELKFLLDPAAVQALREHSVFSGPLRAKSLKSTYFDTPRHALREGGMSLRVREADGRYVQTVKRRAGAALFDRDEWERGIDTPGPQMQALDETPARKVLASGGGDDLAPVFSTEVERITTEVRCGDAVVELSLDEGQIVAGARRAPIRELELELKAGDSGALFAVAKNLAGDAALRLSFESKSERGYRLAGRDDVKALKADRADLTGDLTTGEAFRRIIRSCLSQVTGNAQRLIDVRSADALHQTRVGLRRLRAAFSVFKPMLADSDFERLDSETHWLADSLNAARDLDVLIRSLAPTPDDHPDEDAALAVFRARLFTCQAAAYDDAVAALRSSRYADLMLDLAAWAETGAWTRTRNPSIAERRDESVQALAQRSLEHLRKQVRKKGRKLAELNPERRHKLRIKVKKLRYAADFFGNAFQEAHPKRRQAFIERLRKLQDCLGELNDIAVARRTALAAVDHGAGETAFAGGLVVGRREAQAAALVAQAVDAFRAFSRATPFW